MGESSSDLVFTRMIPAGTEDDVHRPWYADSTTVVIMSAKSARHTTRGRVYMVMAVGGGMGCVVARRGSSPRHDGRDAVNAHCCPPTIT